jgi:hypothetical protein
LLSLILGLSLSLDMDLLRFTGDLDLENESIDLLLCLDLGGGERSLLRIGELSRMYRLGDGLLDIERYRAQSLRLGGGVNERNLGGGDKERNLGIGDLDLNLEYRRGGEKGEGDLR